VWHLAPTVVGKGTTLQIAGAPTQIATPAPTRKTPTTRVTEPDLIMHGIRATTSKATTAPSTISRVRGIIRQAETPDLPTKGGWVTPGRTQQNNYNGGNTQGNQQWGQMHEMNGHQQGQPRYQVNNATQQYSRPNNQSMGGGRQFAGNVNVLDTFEQES